MRFLPGIVTIGVLAGCSALTSLDGLSGGPPSVPTGEGGASTSSGSSASSTTSSSSSASSSTSGGPLPDGGECAFCTNFDSATLAQLAPELNVEEPGKLEIDDRNLRARLPALAGEGHHYVLLERDLSQTARRVSVEFDILIDEDSPWGTFGGNVQLFAVSVEGAKSGGFALFIAKHHSSVTTSSADAPQVYDTTTNDVSREAWVHVRLIADLSPGAGSFKLYYGEALVAERSGIQFPVFDAATTRVKFGIARYNAPTPAFDVRYDNIVVTLP